MLMTDDDVCVPPSFVALHVYSPAIRNVMSVKVKRSPLMTGDVGDPPEPLII